MGQHSISGSYYIVSLYHILLSTLRGTQARVAGKARECPQPMFISRASSPIPQRQNFLSSVPWQLQPWNCWSSWTPRSLAAAAAQGWAKGMQSRSSTPQPHSPLTPHPSTDCLSCCSLLLLLVIWKCRPGPGSQSFPDLQLFSSPRSCWEDQPPGQFHFSEPGLSSTPQGP